MSKGTIWITRAQPGAEKSAQAWRKAGFDPVIAPLVQIAPPKNMPALPLRNAIFLVTSANALRGLEALTDYRGWSILAVGDASASLARKMGFSDVSSAKGNAQALISMVQKTYRPGGNEHFIYASGSDIRTDIAEKLTSAGYQARRDIYYQNTPVASDVQPEFNSITHLALYSAMAAKTVQRYLGRLSLQKTISISPSVDAELTKIPKYKRLIAGYPTEQSMISALL